MVTHIPSMQFVVTLLTLLVFLVLDVDYKARNFQSSGTNAFRTAASGVLRDAPMVSLDLNHESTAMTVEATALSSWPHFYSTCSNWTAFDSSGGFVVLVLGSNCTLGQGVDRMTTPHIVVSSTIRLDSLVWTCCKLLLPSQQPSICQDHIATDFLQRYMLPDIAVSLSDLAVAGTSAEAELLVFLDMISRSYPLHKVVCTEGFVWSSTTRGYHDLAIFGCASPNSFQSEFIGLSNPKVRDMLQQRSWLSVDQFELLGLSFGIRQNSRGVFSVTDGDSSDDLIATLHVDTNFSCFGSLYSLMIAMDLLALLLYVRAGYHSIKWVLGPHYRRIVARQHSSRCVAASRTNGSVVRVVDDDVDADEVSPFSPPSSPSTSSLSPLPLIRTTEATVRKSSRTRSAPSLNAATAAAQVDPMSLDALLDPRDNVLKGVVHCSLFSSSTLVVLVVSSQLISWLFVLPNIVIWSWSLELNAKIRAGVTTFRAVVLALVLCDLSWAGIAKLNEELAYFIASRTFVCPLEIIAIGAGVATYRLADVLAIADRKWMREQQRVFDTVAFPGYVAYGNMFDGTLDFRHNTPYSVFAIVYTPLFDIVALTLTVTAAYAALKGVGYYLWHAMTRLPPTTTTANEPYDPASYKLHGKEHGEYHRLPMELLLDYPIRARSLLRSSFSMEILVADHRVIRPSCYLDAGILPRDGNPG